MEPDRTGPRVVRGSLTEFCPRPFALAFHVKKKEGGPVSRCPRKKLDQEVVSVVVIVIVFRGNLDIVIVVIRLELAEDVEAAIAIQGANARSAPDLLDALEIPVTAVLLLEL